MSFLPYTLMRVYRVFRERAHAEEFLSGRIRFGHLGLYRAIESKGRGDPREGFGEHREYRADRTAVVIQDGVGTEVASPGEVTTHAECGNPIFVCCFTTPPDPAAWARIRDEFGDFVVEIDDSERLIRDIGSALDPADPWQRRAGLALWPAEYTRGELLTAETSPSFTDSLRRSATQKARRDSYQYETRAVLFSHGVWQVDGQPPEVMYVTLPGPIEYARYAP
jgi:hypothetical protein